MENPIYRLVQTVEGAGMIASDLDPAAGVDLLAAMELRGFVYQGAMTRPGVRAELQGQPKFRGLAGPMWDGEREGRPVIRYEDWTAYEQLSA